MRYVILLTLLSMLVNLTAHSQETIKDPALRQMIDSLATVDQKVQQDFMESFKTGEIPKYEKLKAEAFIRHTPILKAIFDKHGYPNYDLVGKKGANNYWLCVQHCDHDLKFQQQVLHGMEKEVNARKADGKNYAYLTDRVNINSGKPQIYGTQVDWKNDSAIAKNLKDPETVNKRRAMVGLETLEEYLAMMNRMHKEMNPK